MLAMQRSAVPRKVLGRRALFAAAIGGIVGQLGSVSLLQGVSLAGYGFLIALVIGLAIAIANAMAYAEMALMMPTARSLSSYAEAAIGNFPAILVVFAGYISAAIFGLPAELILTDQLVQQAIPGAVPQFTGPVVMMVLVAIFNILGTDVFAKVQSLLSATILTFIATMGIVALSGHAATPMPAGGVTHGLATLDAHATAGGVMTLALWVFMGTEFVTPLIPEALRPQRDLPWAMFGGLFALATADVLYAVGGGALMHPDAVLSSGTPHLDYAVAVFGAGARGTFVVLAILATTSVMNTVIASLSRMLVGMAENGQAFPILKWTHPRLGTPVVAVLFVAVLPLMGLFWARGNANAILPFSIAASVSWLLAYMIAQVSLVVLRQRYPHAERPFRALGYPWVPVLAFVGMAYAILNSSPERGLTDSVLKCTALVLGLFAVIGAVWVKFVMKKGLFEPVPVGDLRAGPPVLKPVVTET